MSTNEWIELSKILKEVGYDNGIKKRKYYIDSQYVTMKEGESKRNGYTGDMYYFSGNVNNDIASPQYIYGIITVTEIDDKGNILEAEITDFSFVDTFHVNNAINDNGEYIESTGHYNNNNVTHSLRAANSETDINPDIRMFYRSLAKIEVPIGYLGPYVPKTAWDQSGNSYTFKCIVLVDEHEVEGEVQNTYEVLGVEAYNGTQTNFNANTKLNTKKWTNNDGGGIIIKPDCTFTYKIGSMYIYLSPDYSDNIRVEGTLIARKLYIE